MGNRIKDLKGQKFGKLIVTGFSHIHDHQAYWKCECECGNSVIVRSCRLISGEVDSCGCLRKHRKDISNRRFGFLTAINCVGVDKDKNTLWRCKCDCGKYCIFPRYVLTRGDVKSCGCMRKKLISESHTKYEDFDSKHLASTLSRMKVRCYNNNQTYKYSIYGGRGIKICDEWLDSTQAFIDWAKSHGYSRGLTIDRIDVNGPYSPENCRWVTVKDQANNRRSNRFIEIRRKTLTIAQWIEALSIPGKLRKDVYSKNDYDVRVFLEDRLKFIMVSMWKKEPYMMSTDDILSEWKEFNKNNRETPPQYNSSGSQTSTRRV